MDLHVTGIQLPQGLPSPQTQTKPSLGQGQALDNTKTWQREMERSQMAEWFHSAILPNRVFHPMWQSAADSVAQPKLGTTELSIMNGSILVTKAVEPGAQPSQDAPTSGLLTLILQKADSAKGTIPSASEALSRYDLCAAKLVQFTTAPNAAHSTNDEYPDSPAVAVPHSSPSMELPEIRVHAQWYGKSIHVWLGLNGEPSAQNLQIASVIDELRRLFAAKGESLGSIVCNGRTVFPAENNAKSIYQRSEICQSEQ